MLCYLMIIFFISIILHINKESENPIKLNKYATIDENQNQLIEMQLHETNNTNAQCLSLASVTVVHKCIAILYLVPS